MADKTTITTADDSEIVVEKARGLWEKYNKTITYVGTAIILLIGGWYGYDYFIKTPNENAAAKMIFPAEGLFGKMATAGFNKDSVNIVLNGGTLDGVNITGLLRVINKYGGTDAGNRAKYLTGACYLHIKEYDKAIKYLNEFDPKGAHQIESRTYILLGHAYAEKNNKKEALSFYKKAGATNPKDEFISADAMMTAASYADAVGESKEAISIYQELKEKYPAYSSVRSGEVDKYLAKLGVLK